MIELKVGQYVLARTGSEYSPFVIRRVDTVGPKQVRTKTGGYGWHQTKREDILAAFDTEFAGSTLLDAILASDAPFKRLMRDEQERHSQQMANLRADRAKARRAIFNSHGIGTEETV